VKEKQSLGEERNNIRTLMR